MRFHILTLFPEMVMQGLNTSIIGNAVEQNLIEINVINIRDFTKDRHKKVDDYPYGGGAGMVMQAQPIYDAWKLFLYSKKVGHGNLQRIISWCHGMAVLYTKKKNIRIFYLQKTGRFMILTENL